MKTKVYPTSASSLVIAHPIDGKLRAEGSDWEADGFTARMLTDGAVTDDASRAWGGPPAPEDDTH
jgi:hypothetical protein